MAKKKKQGQPEVYHVEVIYAARVTDDFSWEYRVKWAGYDSESDSWEPQENVASCKDLLRRFWSHIGVDDNDYPVGYVCQASESWIRKERELFASNFPEILKQEKKRAKAEKAKNNTASSSVASTSGLRKSSPVASTSTSSSKTKRKRKSFQVSVAEASSDDDSSDGEPLAKRIRPSTSSTTPTAEDSKEKQKARETPEDTAADAASLFTPPNSADKGEDPTRPYESQVSPVPNGLAPSSASAFPVPSEKRNRFGPVQKTTTAKTTTPGSSLSTKQRLAQAALEIQPPNAKQSLKISLAKLSFKKTKTDDHATSATPVTPAATSGPPQLASTMPLPRRHSSILDRSSTKPQEPTFHVGPTSPVLQRQPSAFLFLPGVTEPSPRRNPVPQSFNDVPNELMTVSPTPLHDRLPSFEDDNQHMVDPNIDPNMEDFLSGIRFSSPADPLMDQADQFLRGVMPTELAAPLPYETTERNQTQETPPEPPETHVPAATLFRSKLPPLPKIQKKFRWDGSLSSVDGEQSEHICDVSIIDSTDPLADGLRLNILLQPLESLRCEGIYDQMDAEQVLLACKTIPQQFARLCPREDKDNEALTSLARTMSRRNQVIFIPLHLDNRLVALLLIVTSNARRILRQLNVPESYRQNASTPAVVLLAWSLPNYEQHEWRQGLHKPVSNMPTYEPPDTNIKLQRHRRHHTSLHALRFPKELYEFMNKPDRTFCLWWEGGDGTRSEQKWETKALMTVLRNCHAKDVGFKADVRAVFVHIGSINTLHRLPAFVERRTKRPEINFYTYGTHHKIPPYLWGIRPIYPVGGIVTFTPSALLGNTDVLRLRIRQIATHDLWECYVLPSVIGMASKLCAYGNDPLDVFDSGRLFAECYLKMIEEGDIAMMQSSPLEPYFTNPLAKDWRAKNEAQRDFDRRGYLEQALKDFNEYYSNVPESRWLSMVEDAISKDLRMMEMQPCIMSEYRRFVIIKGPQEDVKWDKDGFEWVTAEQFDFRDQSFEKWKESRLEQVDDWDFFL